MAYRPSIRNVATIVAVVVVAFVALAMAAIWQLTRHDQAVEVEAQLHETARSYARVVAQQVRTHRRLLEHLATDRGVQEFLVFGDRVGAERWAQATRPLLADSVGLTLVTGEGEVLGNAANMRIGPACRADLKVLARGETLPGPRVHRERADLEHFDLSVPVHDNEGRLLGLLFASFSLRVLSDAIAMPDPPHTFLSVLDANGHTLARSGSDRPAPDSIRSSAPVPDTDWRVELVQPVGRLSISGGWFWAGTLLVGIVVMIIITAGGMLAGRWLSRDLLTLNRLLDDVAAKRSTNGEPQARIAETAAVLPKVRALAQLIGEQQEKLLLLSRTDELTGLGNRRQFNEHCEQAVRFATRGTTISLALIDVDGLKRLNDAAGHPAGDRLLKLCAQALAARVRDSDIVARLGGDEFAILFFGMSRDEAHNLIERLRTTFQDLQAADDVLGDAPRCTLSIGLSRIDPATDRDVPALLTRVDRALYAAKAQGRDTVVLA